MSNLRAYITADKAGFLQYLDHLIEEHQIAFNNAKGVRNKAHEAGVISGLSIARRAVDNWANLATAMTPIAQGYDKHEYQPDFEKSWNPCQVCGFDRNNGVHELWPSR